MVRGNGWRGGTALGTGTWAAVAGLAGATASALMTGGDSRLGRNTRRQGTGARYRYLQAFCCTAGGTRRYKHVQAQRCLRTAQSVPKSTGHLQQHLNLDFFPTSPSAFSSNNPIQYTTDRLQNMPGERNEAVHGRTRGWQHGE